MTTPTLTESLAQEEGGSDAAVRKAAAPFAHADGRQSALQLVTSFGPFLTGCLAMHLAAQVSWQLVLALAVPTGALLVRVFVVQDPNELLRELQKLKSKKAKKGLGWGYHRLGGMSL